MQNQVFEKRGLKIRKALFSFPPTCHPAVSQFPEITVVMDCYDGGSIHVAHQKHSRALTPGPTKHTDTSLTCPLIRIEQRKSFRAKNHP